VGLGAGSLLGFKRGYKATGQGGWAGKGKGGESVLGSARATQIVRGGSHAKVSAERMVRKTTGWCGGEASTVTDTVCCCCCCRTELQLRHRKGHKGTTAAPAKNREWVCRRMTGETYHHHPTPLALPPALK